MSLKANNRSQNNVEIKPVTLLEKMDANAFGFPYGDMEIEAIKGSLKPSVWVDSQLLMDLYAAACAEDGDMEFTASVSWQKGPLFVRGLQRTDQDIEELMEQNEAICFIRLTEDMPGEDAIEELLEATSDTCKYLLLGFADRNGNLSFHVFAYREGCYTESLTCWRVLNPERMDDAQVAELQDEIREKVSVKSYGSVYVYPTTYSGPAYQSTRPVSYVLAKSSTEGWVIGTVAAKGYSRQHDVVTVKTQEGEYVLTIPGNKYFRLCDEVRFYRTFQTKRTRRAVLTYTDIYLV